MNNYHFKQLLLLPGIVGILMILGGRSAHAESFQNTSQLADTPEISSDLSTPVTEAAPTPGTVETSATNLQPETLTAQAAPTPEATTETPSQTVAQAVNPGQATRSGSSYVGIGGNIGFGGRTALGRGSFTAFSKIGLTDNLSARPEIIVRRRPAILLPVTVDFPVGSVVGERVSAAPYIGGGAVISTGRDSVVRGLVTGGVDVPVSDRITGTAAVNVGFLGKTEVGLRLGVGYNF